MLNIDTLREIIEDKSKTQEELIRLHDQKSAELEQIKKELLINQGAIMAINDLGVSYLDANKSDKELCEIETESI